MTDRISERRLKTNSYMLMVNSFLFSIFGFASAYKNTNDSLWLTLIPLGGLIISIAWKGLISSYQQLNSAKFEVIHDMETELPKNPYDMEWKIIKEKNKKRYISLSFLESLIPSLFGGLYIFLLLYALDGFGITIASLYK